jgi:uncharacterized protein involved in exopolysaccharide biosynthesis
MLAKDDDPESGEAALFDRERIREYLAFLVGAVRRRRILVAGVFSSIVALALAALAALPKTYHVEARLLAQRNVALSTRVEGPESVPTRGAVEMIGRRENLVALAQATDLVRHWDEHRAPGQRLIDALRRLAARGEDEQDPTDAIVERLEKRLLVTVGEGTVTIAIDWPDAHMACLLVDVAQQNFLEARHAQEVTAISESVSILRSHADRLRRNVDDVVAALDDLRAGRRPKAEGVGATTGAPDPHRLAESRLDAEQIQVALLAKQRALDDLEAFRRHRYSELQARLAEQRATFTDNHPTIGDLQATIAALSVPSPQLKALREEVGSLRAQERRIRVKAGGLLGAQLASGVSAASGQPHSEVLIVDPALRDERDPAVTYARDRLRDAMDQYAASREKVEAAQIDLETAQVAFKYRYSIITPAKLPKGPAKPSVLKTLVAAVLAAGLGAVLLAVVVDVRAGRIEERWQMERLLDRPLLAEIEVEAPWRSSAR